MSLGPNRWHVIAESTFPWEREALEWLRAQLPNQDPWHVWTNFEFIDDEGKVNEVDALALTPAGLVLVEIKSRPGTVTGDAHTWTWTTDGRERSYDNPLLLTDRKSKRLASLLKRQSAIIKAKVRLPFVEPAVFLSSATLTMRLQGNAAAGVFQRGRPGAHDDSGIVGALARGVRSMYRTPVDGQQVKAIAKALAEAGIRPSNKYRRVGDYQLGKLIADGPSYQEWDAKHVSVDVQRRIRIYNLATASSPEARETRVRQAQREFTVLEGIEHSGVLRCREYKDTELGPALIFEHDPKAVRLDHFLRDEPQKLGVDQRLQLVRGIAEVLAFAHSRRLYHRALGPQSVLVKGTDNGELRVQLMNWQTAARNPGAGSATGTIHHTTGTQHVEDYVDDPGLVYLAPETTRADPAHGAELDVFSLGCLTYLIFSGEAPAASTLELSTKLREGQGLRLSNVLDGCSPKLLELVQYSTNPEVITRYDSIRDFLSELDAVEDELTAPDPEQTVDPSQARAEDRVDGGFTVVRRMGRGSSSDALLVKPDGSDEQLILKVAVDVSHTENLSAEADALRKLRHPNIVELRDVRTVAGRTALLLRSAGNDTLAQLLKQGRLSLDMLQRFGEELIDAVRHLEDRAVVHRDIKPDNIGIADSRTGRKQLVLFDFSLTRVPPENISAGTPPYLDPFLPLRPHRSWDLHAERFAAAVTLYEMAVGRVPTWGDGQTAPHMIDVEAKIDLDIFHPAVREPLAAFFVTALRRDFKERYDNAEDMLRHWRAVFERATTAHPISKSDDAAFETLAFTVTAQTTMAELGYSLEAQDALERMGVQSVAKLLAVNRIEFRYLRGVGDKVRKEIRIKAKELARLRPDLTHGRTTLHESDEVDTDSGKLPVTVNELAASLLPKRPVGDERPEDAALAHFLGLEGPGAARWPSIGDAAQSSNVDRTTLTETLIRARERWLKNNKAITELRQQIEALLTAQGNVMTADEAALALLALRGCALQDDADRMRLAHAVIRAAVEAERHRDQPRFDVFDQGSVPLVAVSSAWADFARRLGEVADTCALSDPLYPPSRALEAIEGVLQPLSTVAATDVAAGIPLPQPIAPSRLLRLATMASRKASLSSRQEIYPRGMSALQSLKHSVGAVLGAQLLKPSEIQDRVRGRYPEAERLPGHPHLDRLLEEAGVPLEWDPHAANGAGAYRRRTLSGSLTVGLTTQFGSRRPTARGSESGQPDADATEASSIEQRLQRVLKDGGLLTLTVDPRLAQAAESELLRRFGAVAGGAVERINLDALLLGEMHRQAEAAKVPWTTVLRADIAEPGNRDWRNLLGLAKRCVPALKRALFERTAPALVVNGGLLARYELMEILVELESQVGRPGRTPAAWLLLPTHQPGLAVIDATPVPLVNATRVVALPAAWIRNVHRAEPRHAVAT
ncbi:serine/threonine protein kinase [Panacagrimonas perspica]|uniref:Serine/threonine protein kinase n=1 Tax=Panacagrimonas perspica TaxID=381431 RepID=A0A4R7NR54_9GAMM|nr:BREX system serine/threonine kinase PglW [Panacagrimonas perspica]TDU23278.1 serine/threonine protein kinase [Panacagrimonas perspica]THD01038.1 protein kinase [Panacagrimonas perspica]